MKLFRDPLAFEAEAGISVGGAGGSGLEIAGHLLAPWHPKGFDFLTIDKFAIKAIITPEAVPTLVELHAKFDVRTLSSSCFYRICEECTHNCPHICCKNSRR